MLEQPRRTPKTRREKEAHGREPSPILSQTVAPPGLLPNGNGPKIPMSRVHLFADESGNFDFSRGRGATRYFILTTVLLEECSGISQQLQDLRHRMAWEGIDHPGPFHAHHDPRPVRERVFDIICQHDLRVDSLILEKAKTKPDLRATDEGFYQCAWYYLMKFIAPRLHSREMLVVSASIGQKKRRLNFYTAVREVMKQVGGSRYGTACWDASSDACLQVADYCGWAIQRKWERGDTHFYGRLSPRIGSEYDLFARGADFYY